MLFHRTPWLRKGDNELRRANGSLAGIDFERGEKELRTDSFTTNEKADRVWHVIQKERMKRKSTKLEPQRRFTIPDNTPLVQPSQVISGQWEPG